MVNLSGIEINWQLSLMVLVALLVILTPTIDALLEWVGKKLFGGK